MSKFVEPYIIVNRLFYDTEIVNDSSLSYEEPKTKNHYYRAKRRMYLKDIRDIEEYKYTNFDHMTNSKLTRVYTDFGQIVVEMGFDALCDIINDYDKNKINIISN